MLGHSVQRLLLLLLLIAAGCQAAPTTYDQRQDGDVNVKVDLDNFVVLIARPISALDVFGAMGQLLADTRNSQLPEHKETEAKSSDNNEQSRNNVPAAVAAAALDAEASPVVVQPEAGKEEVAVASSGAQQTEVQKDARSLEHPVLKVKSRESKDKAKSIGKYTFVEAVEEPQSLKLIGDSIENCGPGRSRDRLGICQEDQ